MNFAKKQQINEVIKMIAAIALDDNNGLLFNNRRQSRDSVLIDRLVGMKVNIEKFSSELFPEGYKGDSDIYFIEKNISILSEADRLIVFRWNRKYPADVRVDLSDWKKVSESDFAGSSHDKITEEHYEKT